MAKQGYDEKDKTCVLVMAVEDVVAACKAHGLRISKKKALEYLKSEEMVDAFLANDWEYILYISVDNYLGN